MATHKDNLQLVVGAKDKATSNLKRIQKAVIGIGAAYLGWRSAKAIIGGIIEAGMESEKVWNDVRASLDRHNISVEKNLGSIKKFADSMQTLTGISDELIGEGIQVLLDYNNDLKTSFDLVKVATDLSVGGHMDMKAALDLVGKASVGYTGTLSRYGIIIDEAIPKSEKFAEALRQINQRFGGAAAERMETTAGKLALLEQTFADLQETLFRIFSPTIISAMTKVTNLLKMFIPASEPIKSTADEIDNLKTQIDKLKDIEGSEERIKSLREEIDYLKLILGATSQELIEFAATSEAVRRLEEMSRKLEEGFELDYEAVIKLKDEFSKYAYEIVPDATNVIIGGLNQTSGAFKDVGTNAKITGKEINAISQKTAEMMRTTLDLAIELAEEQTAELLDFYQTMGDEAEEVTNRQFNTLVHHVKGANDQYKQAYRDREQMAAQFASRATGYLWDMADDSRSVFKSMANDFWRYFIQATLKAMMMDFAPKFLATFKFWDVAANDRALMREGGRFVDMLSVGIFDRLRTQNIANRISQQINPAAITVSGQYNQPMQPIAGNTYIFVNRADVGELLEDIEQSISLGVSSLAMEEAGITGERDVLID